MPWSAPVNPVSGTVITVAYAVSNILDPLRWLRLMTGNADPPGTSYVVGSSTVAATAWTKILTDYLGDGAVTNPKLGDDAADDRVLAAGAALANLGYTPVNAHTISVSAVNAAFSAAASGMYEATGGSGAPGGTGAWYIYQCSETNAPARYCMQIVCNINDVRETYIRLIIDNVSSVFAKLWTDANDGNGSGLDADLWRGLTPATTTVGTATNAGNVTASIGGTPLASYNAPTATLAANATQVGGLTPTASPGPGRIPIADGAGKLDAWVTSSGGGGATELVGGMVIGWVNGVASIPGGWTRYAAADGRLLVGAGTSGEHTFVDGNSYGTTWAHSHTSPSHGHAGVGHSHSGASLGVGGTLGGPSSSGTGGGTGATFADGSHSHNASGLDVSGNTDPATASVSSVASTVDATTILLPVRALIWIVKS